MELQQQCIDMIYMALERMNTNEKRWLQFVNILCSEEERGSNVVMDDPPQLMGHPFNAASFK